MNYTERYGPASERVSRGLAALSDEQIDKIDNTVLDIADPSDCVLGQIFGNYLSDAADRFLLDLGRGDGIPGQHGFEPYDYNDARELNAEWDRQIRHHRRNREAS